MRLRFGVFELDEQAGELRRAGQAVDIQPKPLALLSYLIRERSRVVSSDELLEALWPDAVVSSGSLTRAVSHARRALRDTHRGELIRSVARRGYRFMGDVVEVGAAADAVAPAAASAALARSGFVGRGEALAQLEALWRRVLDGGGHIALVTGPAGVGKTRLTELFVEQLQQRGAAVIVGRCRDRDGAPAFWIWGQLLRQLADDPGFRDAMRELVDSPELGDLVPALSSASRETRELPDDAQRFLFYDAVAHALRACARLRPLVLLLEDLHWASSPSLRLLEHLACELDDAPLLLLATVRDENRDAGDPVDRTALMLRQEERGVHVPLAGLSRGEVGELLALSIGSPAPADLISEVFARTEGIPFFVSEAIRLLEERGDLKEPARLPRRGLTLPASASDLIRRPLDALSEPAARLLGAGAVAGREFTLAEVAAIADVPRADALDLLDEAIEGGVVSEQPDAVASYRFTHALFQEAVYERLRTGARAKLHARAADRLERQNADALEPVLGELAHHYYCGIAVCDPNRAFEIATQAAQSAQRQFAYEQAASHYEQAAEVLEHCEDVDASRRLVTLLSLGEAHRLSGERARRREVFQRAMEQARALDSPRDFARAAIGFCAVSEWSPYDAAARTSVEEALVGLEQEMIPECARLHARLGYLDVQHPELAEPEAREALRIARACNNPEAIQEAIYVLHYITLGPDGMRERAGRVDELFEASLRCNSRDVGTIGMLDLAGEALAVGDRERADALRRRASELTTHHPSPTMQWHMNVYDTGIAQLEGRHDDALNLARDNVLIGRRIGHPYARAVFDGQQAVQARLRGDSAAAIELLRPAAGARRGATHWVKAFIGREELRRGNQKESQTLFEELARDDFRAIPRNLRWSATLPEVALLCADLGDAARARQLLELLATAEGQHGVMPMVINYGGPLSRAAARLWLSLGRADEALACYEDALQSTAALGARPMAAIAKAEMADLLRRSGDARRAGELSEAARAAAKELGLTALEQQLDAGPAAR